MGHIDVAHVTYVLPDGRTLLDNASFRVGESGRVALVGPNGAGKTTLLRIVAGELSPSSGAISRSGNVGFMPQFIGSVGTGSAGRSSTVRKLLLSFASAPLRNAGEALRQAADALQLGDEKAGLRYASAFAAWGDAGGHELEVLWDVCTVAALGRPLQECESREIETLSGGEQKRLVLEVLLRGGDEVLLLDEPDNYLDVRGKQWLEEQLRASGKTILFVSHDRELLDRVATAIVTVEEATVWTFGGPFAAYHAAMLARHERLEELYVRWSLEHERLVKLVHRLRQQAAGSSKLAPRYRAMQTRLRKFEEAGPPLRRPREQRVSMDLRGDRSGTKVVTMEGLSFPRLVRPFDYEIYFGDRVGVLGSNGTGKTLLLSLLAGRSVAHEGTWRLGARVAPGLFSQTHHRPDLIGRTLVDLLQREGLDRGKAIGVLRRYELERQSDHPFELLSGGQQARFQILLLQVRGVNLLLLDEPTDNLDIASAEALERALLTFNGTVLAVTHDRWFARNLNRFLILERDGAVREALEPVW